MKKLVLLCCVMVAHLYAADNSENVISKPITIAFLKNHQDLLTAVAKIWWEGQGARQQLFKDDQSDLMIASLKKSSQNNKLPLCMIALEDGEPVGMVRLTDVWVQDPAIAPKIATHKEWSPWICSLIVKETHQGRGIATQLLSSVEQQARALGYKTLYLAAEASLVSIYERRNYEKFDEDTFRGEPKELLKKSIR